MSNFVALFRGQSMKDAQLIGVSNSPATVAKVAESMLSEQRQSNSDPVLNALNTSRQKALTAIRDGQ